MRVIGGDLRGRRLRARAPGTVRPTSDRVREAVFDILFSLGGVEGMVVADLFAGTGAVGIEALSRGAASVTFVDRDPRSIETVRANLASVGLSDAERNGAAVVIRSDVERWVSTAAERYDLVVCDPPYGFAEWDGLVGRIPAGLAVLESGTEVVPPAGWGVLRSRRYGGTIVTVVRFEPDNAPDSAPDRETGRATGREKGLP
ncbi:MAG: RsmD family RNA methyltransferase [Acidimicrobiales bacterium]